jgi:hypothetical protein
MEFRECQILLPTCVSSKTGGNARLSGAQRLDVMYAFRNGGSDTTRLLGGIRFDIARMLDVVAEVDGGTSHGSVTRRRPDSKLGI